jgi:hypothetical protein
VSGPFKLNPPLTFIITNSYDLTANKLVERLGVDRVFRYNFDIWQQYPLVIDETGFCIRDAVGREVRQQHVAKVLWRKPISRYRLAGHRPHATTRWGAVRRLLGAERALPSREENYQEEEMYEAVVEMKNLLWRQQKVVLIEPAAYMRLGKLVQLDLAKVYFHVPKYEFVMGADRQFYSDSKRIVKSLTSMPLAKNVFLWTTPVRPAELHRGTPWLLQDLVDARFDVTVVYLRGGIFAFELDRTAFTDKSVDWREVGELTTPLWRPHRLPEDMCARVEKFMTDANLHYGRLDFLYDGSTYAFLEVNSNGEWEWLDRDGSNGVLPRVVSEIHPDTPVHPIPIPAAQNKLS